MFMKKLKHPFIQEMRFKHSESSINLGQKDALECALKDRAVSLSHTDLRIQCCRPTIAALKQKPRHVTPLSSSISSSTERLAKIVHDLQEVNQRLDMVKEQLNMAPSDDSVTSPRDESDLEVKAFDLYFQSRLELRKAQSAHGEVKAVLSSVTCAWSREEQEIHMRACLLRRESFKFQKLSPAAVAKIRTRNALVARRDSQFFDRKAASTDT